MCCQMLLTAPQSNLLNGNNRTYPVRYCTGDNRATHKEVLMKCVTWDCRAVILVLSAGYGVSSTCRLQKAPKNVQLSVRQFAD